MKKTALVLLVALLFVPAGLFAGLFGVSVGATAQYTGPFDLQNAGEFDWEQLADPTSYGFGADVRLRVLFAEIGVSALYSEGYVDTTEYVGDAYQLSGVVTAGLSLDFLGLVRVGLGMGPRVYALMNDDGDAYVWQNGTLLGTDTDFESLFLNAPMTYRLTADLKLGSLSVGLNYTADSTGFTFGNGDVGLLAPDFANGRLGASVLFNLF